MLRGSLACVPTASRASQSSPLFPGVDDVFVFINTYRQATHLKDLRLRMIHTIQTAGKATFFTSLTTAAAYAANIFSQVHCSFAFGALRFCQRP